MYIRLFRKVKFIRRLEELSVYAFHKIMETSDYSYLIKNWNESDKIIFNRDEVAKIWAGLYNDYCVLTNNNKSLLYYRVSQRLMWCETRKYIGEMIRSQLSMRKMKPSLFMAYKQRLELWQFNYVSDKQNEKGLSDLERQIRACDNEIGLKRDELEKMKEKGVSMTLEQQVVKAEQALGRNMVDPRAISVVKWHYMMKEIEAITDAKRKEMLNRKRK